MSAGDTALCLTVGLVTVTVLELAKRQRRRGGR
jgi:hypothetical protein